MSKHEEKQRSRTWQRVTLAAALVVGSVLTNVQAASASEVPISGSQVVDVVAYWDTPRTNSQVQNRVSIQVTNAGGGTMTVAIRPTAAAGPAYARATGSGTAWTLLRHDTSGNYWVSWGTFYLNTQLTNLCGGSGCGSIPWTANFRWNIST